MCAWSTVEIGLGLTASSLATLTPLFRKIRVFKRTHLSGQDDDAPSARTPAANAPSFVHKNGGGAPRVAARGDGLDDVEALKHHRSSTELRQLSSDEVRHQSTDELRHQPSDEFRKPGGEMELYRFRW